MVWCHCRALLCHIGSRNSRRLNFSHGRKRLASDLRHVISTFNRSDGHSWSHLGGNKSISAPRNLEAPEKVFSSWTPQFRRNHGMDRRNDPCHSSKGSDFGTARNSRCVRYILDALQGATPLARLHRQRACRSRNLPSRRTWVSALNTSDI